MRVDLLLLAALAFAGTFVESRSAYVKQETAELDRWDVQISQLKRLTPSDDRYKAADDLQLQLKDLRGDLLKLKTTSEENFTPLQVKFEKKLETARKAFKDVEKPTPPNPRIPAPQ